VRMDPPYANRHNARTMFGPQQALYTFLLVVIFTAAYLWWIGKKRRR
jgi:hypothetical protein